MADYLYKDRRFKESPWDQSIQETRAHTITIPTTWGTADFSSLSCSLYEDPNGDNTDKSSTLTGSVTSSGQVITTKNIVGSELTEGKDYRFEVKFTTSEGDTEVAWGIIKATR